MALSDTRVTIDLAALKGSPIWGQYFKMKCTKLRDVSLILFQVRRWNKMRNTYTVYNHLSTESEKKFHFWRTSLTFASYFENANTCLPFHCAAKFRMILPFPRWLFPPGATTFICSLLFKRRWTSSSFHTKLGRSGSAGYVHLGQFLKSPWSYLRRRNSIWPLREKTENRKGGFRVKYMAWGIR